MSHASEYDSHGHTGNHGHVIVSQWTLRAVLAALMFFTVLTVGLSLAETWLASVFHIALPGWVNVAVALAIAAIKTLIVVAFFMQLKYDNPLNTMILVFTIITVMFFLGFTALDLCQRGTLDRSKAQYIIPGGSGLTGIKQESSVAKGFTNTSIVDAARITAKNKGEYDPHHAGHEGGPDRGPEQSITNAGFAPVLPAFGSSAQVSRPVRGVTIPGLPGYVEPKSHDAHAAHSEAEDKHGETGDIPPTQGDKPAEQPDAAPATPAKPEHH